MRHAKNTFELGRNTAHRRALVANLLIALIDHGRIATTLTKAKRLRRFADHMISLAKGNTLNHRRQAIAALGPQGLPAVRKLFGELGPRYKERASGYTRIVKYGARRGDGAALCTIEYV